MPIIGTETCSTCGGEKWEHQHHLLHLDEPGARVTPQNVAAILGKATKGSTFALPDGATGRTKKILEGYHPGVLAIQKLAEYNLELIAQLTILCDWVEKLNVKYCRCENNGDLCDFHEMLAQAREALK